MKTKLLLRIAAVIMLLHGLGHTFGVMTWQNPRTAEYQQTVEKMQDVQFDFMGKSNATLADFYSGFGYGGTILLLLSAALLWVISDLRHKSVIKLLWIIGVAIVLLGIIETIYFFPFAVSFCIVSAALVFIAIFQLKKASTKKQP